MERIVILLLLVTGGALCRRGNSIPSGTEAQPACRQAGIVLKVQVKN